MPWAILFVVGLAYLGYRVGFRSSPTEIRGELPAATHHESALDLLRALEQDGYQPQGWVVTQAIEEAYSSGNWRLAAVIADRYPCEYEISGGPPPSESPPTEPVTASPTVEARPSSLPEHFTSPIEGLDDDDWSAFVKVMASDPIELRTDKHVGTFHQRIDRLKALGIDPSTLTDFDAQYRAFCAECKDHLDRHERTFRSTIASPIKVGADTHPLTASGLLGLFRAAGPRNAMQWIEVHQQPVKDDKYPNTTKLFLSCNGLF